METLGKRIGDLRREKGLKQDDLAERLGISPQAVSKWENDQTCPDISVLPQLAEILDVSLEVLLTGEKANVPKVRLLPEGTPADINSMMLRLVVDSADGDKVRINLPMALVKVALEIGMKMPQVNGNDVLKDIDLAEILSLVEHGAIGNLCEVESSDGDKVSIFVEEV